MYNYAYNRMRTSNGGGMGIEEARILHRRAYGGLVRHYQSALLLRMLFY